MLLPHLPTFQQRLYEALLAGSVPVVVSSKQPFLPFHEMIDWRLAMVKVARARLSAELHFILRSIAIADLLEMKRMGRFFLENYLLNTKGFLFAIDF